MVNNHSFVCLDFETGGYHKDGRNAVRFAITEVGLISYDQKFEIISEYSSYIKGQWKDDVYVGYDSDLIYEKEALKVTGITIEKLESQGQNYKKVVDQLIAEFSEALKICPRYKKPILVGHNIGYDIPFLLYLFKFAEKDISAYLSGFYDHFGEYQLFAIDTMYLSRICDIENKLKHSLGDVCKHLGFEHVDAHSALPDVRSTMKVHKIFTDRMRSQGTVENKKEERFRDHFQITTKSEE